MMKKILYIVILCSLIGCIGQKNKREKENKISIEPSLLPEINLNETYPAKRISLQDVAEIEYIPMETRADVLIGKAGFLTKTVISDSLIITYSLDGSVFVFNRQGKNLSTFNHTGRGPEEYQKIYDLMVDVTAKEIYILDQWSRWRIYVYTLDGSFIRVIKLPAWYRIHQMFNYDKESLLCYEGFGAEFEKEENFNKQPYALLSKKDATIHPLKLTFSDRFCSRIYPFPDRPTICIDIEAAPIIKNGDRFLISDFVQDTIYSYKQGDLVPYLLKTPPSLWKDQIPKLARVKLFTEKFTLIECLKFKLLEGNSPLTGGFPVTEILYDHLTEKVYTPVFINNDYKDGKIMRLRNSRCELPLNYTCAVLPVSRLLDDYAAGKLRGELKEIASRLNEDDNPVLMLIKFRD